MPIIGAIGNASEYAYRSNLVDSPDPFDFTDLFNVDPGLTYYSDYVKITGFKSQLRVTIEPGASYSLFASVFDNQNVNSLAFDNDSPLQANFSQDLDPSLRFTTDSTFIRNNQSIRLSRTIPSPIFPPASFDSNLITFDQLNPRLSQSVLPTDIIPDVFGSTYTSVVSIGTSVQDWIIQVRDVDSVPDPIIIPSSLDVLAGVGVTTLSYTITGLEPNIKFSASIADGNGGIIIDGITPSVTNALIGNGDIINLDTISSDYDQTKSINFGVGTYSTTWNVTTQPLDLSATFTFFKQNVVTGVFETTGISNFTPLTNRAISTLYNTTGAYPANRAEAFVINGLNVGLATDITFTSGASYEVRRPSGGTLIKGYDDPPIQIINGDAIRVRLTSSSTYSTAVTTTATVGTTSQQVWSITTQADPAPPPVVPPPVVPPPPITTRAIQRRFNADIDRHFYGWGSAVSGTITATSSVSAAGILTFNYTTNAIPFLGDAAYSNSGFVQTPNASSVVGAYPTPTTVWYFVRPIRIYNVNRQSDSGTSAGTGAAPITYRGDTDFGQIDRGPLVGTPSSIYNRRGFIWTNNNNGLPTYVSSITFSYSLNNFGLETGFNLATTSPGTGAQRLFMLYNNNLEDHLISFSSTEGTSVGYELIQELGWAYPGGLYTVATAPAGYRRLFRVLRANGEHFYTIDETEAGNEVNLRGGVFEGSEPGINRYAWVL